MRDIIDQIVEGNDNDKFSVLMEQLVAGKFYVFAQEEGEDGLTINFLHYLLEDDEDIEYIPMFTDEDEVNEFVKDADVPEGYEVYEFDGDLFAELIDDEQFLMINPVSGGIVFQGEHLKTSSGDEA